MTARYQARFQLVGYLLGLFALLSVGLWMLEQVHMVANVLVVSILLAYLIAPGVEALVRRGLPKVLAITCIYILLGALLSFFLAFLVPVVTREFEKLLGNLGGMLSNLETLVDSLLGQLHEWAPEALKPSLDPRNFQFNDLALQLQREAPALLGGSLPGVFVGMKSAAGVLGGAFLVPLLTFYILMDSDKYRRAFVSVVPRHRRPAAQELLTRVDSMLGRYIRGQLIVCVSIGFFVAVALSLLGVDYAVLIGIFAGVVDIIPYVGVLIGLVPAFLIALINKGVFWAILTIVVLECIHWLEGHVVVPAVVGHSVGLPPLTVMVALLSGAEVGGIMGMLVAIPLAALVRVVVEFYIENNPNLGEEAEPAPAAVADPPGQAGPGQE